MDIASQMLCNEVCMEILPHMTASYVLGIFHKLNEKPVSVTVRRGKHGPPTTAIIRFPNEICARSSIIRLDRTIVPDNTIPLFRFKLIQGKIMRPFFDAWVGNLTPDVDDILLFKYFASCYDSTIYAKVLFDKKYTNGCAIVKFGKEEHLKACIQHGSHKIGLGRSPLIIKPYEIYVQQSNKSDSDLQKLNSSSGQKVQHTLEKKSHGANNSIPSLMDLKIGEVPASENKIDPIQPKEKQKEDKVSPLQNIYLQWNELNTSADNDDYIPKYPNTENKISLSQDITQLIEYSAVDDVDKLNMAIVERDFILWGALENSRWLPIPLLSTSLQLTSSNSDKIIS